ncbi:hypothetical protein ACFO9Q_08605 [Paenibacillus sp. GCM10023252]|uniref:hypothetical protein n=1 Tax=Paenibacillus sp. GCM10023252 TaxID=3252649 RepID=UPI003609F5FA
MFENEFEKFLEKQKSSAKGMRLELLNKDMTGEKKMLKEALYPVFRSFDGMILEHEVISSTGVKIYVDVFYEPLKLAFECEGFAVHGENITRERFAFEKMRVRTLVIMGYKYVPFTWDELDKKPDACRRAVYELIGRYGGAKEKQSEKLTLQERELLLSFIQLNRPVKASDACQCLGIRRKAGSNLLRKMAARDLLVAAETNRARVHSYLLHERIWDLI